LLGYDTIPFLGTTDSELVNIALNENRIIFTRDTHILKRRLVTSGAVKSTLLYSDNPETQIEQICNEFDLLTEAKPFSLCLECNFPLKIKTRDDIRARVPIYVWQTRNEYMECCHCQRIYWKGTHWESMISRLKKLREEIDKKKK
jgi:hypothetical protein